MGKAISDGMKQIVILGCGWDVKSFKVLHAHPGVRIIEGDFKETIEYREATLAAIKDDQCRAFLDAKGRTAVGLNLTQPDDMLQILVDEKLSNAIKKPFLRFMLWVYMNTAGGIIESGAGDLPHES